MWSFPTQIRGWNKRKRCVRACVCLRPVFTIVVTLSCLLWQMVTKVADVLQGNKVDAILCVAGGWGGGNAASAGGPHYHSIRH